MAMFSIRKRITEEINTIISPSETIILVLRQSLISSIAPNAIVVTDRRIIIVHHSFWGLYLKFNLINPTTMDIVQFKNVMSVAMEKGKILATIRLRVLGYEANIPGIKYEWDINGFRIFDGLKAANTIGRLVEGRTEVQNSKIAPDAKIEYNDDPKEHVDYAKKNAHERQIEIRS